MSELKKFDFEKWLRTEYDPGYSLREETVLIMSDASKACSEHYEQQWNTRPEGEYIKKSDVIKEFNILYNRLMHNCPNFGFTQKALEVFWNFEKQLSNLETHSVESGVWDVNKKYCPFYDENWNGNHSLCRYKEDYAFCETCNKCELNIRVVKTVDLAEQALKGEL